MKNLNIMLILFLVASCSKSNNSSNQKSNKINIDYDRLIELPQVNGAVLTSDTTLNNSSGSEITETISSNIVKNEQLLQVVKVENKERRASVSLSIDVGSPNTGISIDNSCGSSLSRRQACYIKILVDSNVLNGGDVVSHDIIINNKTLSFEFNIQAEPPADNTSNLSLRNTNQDCGDLYINLNEKCLKSYQVVNEGRTSLELTIDDSLLHSSMIMINECPSSLSRRKSCYISIEVDSSGKTPESVSGIVSVNGSNLNISANLIEQTQEEINQENQGSLTIDDSNLNLGDIQIGESKEGIMSIKNESRNSINLNIDELGLSEFSISGCPESLPRGQTCYLTILYDASGKTEGLKTETFSVVGLEYYPTANVVPQPSTSVNYDDGSTFDSGIVYE